MKGGRLLCGTVVGRSLGVYIRGADCVALVFRVCWAFLTKIQERTAFSRVRHTEPPHTEITEIRPYCREREHGYDVPCVRDRIL